MVLASLEDVDFAKIIPDNADAIDYLLMLISFLHTLGSHCLIKAAI